MPKKGLHGAGTHRFQTAAFRQAAQEFTAGLWSDPGRRSLLQQTMHTVWEEYKQEARYEQLRRRLSEAAKGRTARQRLSAVK